MADLAAIGVALGVGLVSSVPAALVAYRQGRQAEEDARDRDAEQRLNAAELEIADLRAIIRERKELRGPSTPYIGPERRRKQP